VAKKRTGLGRGLAALLGDPALGQFPHGLPDGAPDDVGEEDDRPTGNAAAAYSTAHPVPMVIDLPITSIRPNPRQPRRRFDPEALAELARSIASTGVVQPIIVRPLEPGSYELIAGERRWRASQMAGYTLVPAILRQASDVESLEISLIENVVRQQLNPVDEAFALHVLLDDLGATQEALAERIGKSRSAVTNKLRLLDLPGEVQELLAGGELSEGHGRALLGLKDRGEQLRMARRAASQGLSVRAVEADVKRQGESAGSGSRPSPSVSLPDELAEEARECFWSAAEVVPRIRLRADGNAGRIELPFGDLEELRRILDRLSARD
jgi:ParB family transcriptional regulator, chromosome partitioning protein